MAQDLTTSQFSLAPFPPGGTNWLAKGHTLPPFMKEELAALKAKGKMPSSLEHGLMKGLCCGQHLTTTPSYSSSQVGGLGVFPKMLDVLRVTHQQIKSWALNDSKCKALPHTHMEPRGQD